MSPEELKNRADEIVRNIGKGNHILDLMDWADVVEELENLIDIYVTQHVPDREEKK